MNETDNILTTWILGGCLILGAALLFYLICMPRFETMSGPMLVFAGLLVVGGTVGIVVVNSARVLVACVVIVTLGFIIEYWNAAYLQQDAFKGGRLVCRNESSGEIYHQGGEWVFGYPGNLVCLESEFGEHGIVNGAKYYAVFKIDFNVGLEKLKERIDFLRPYIDCFAYKYSDFNSVQFGNHEQDLKDLVIDFSKQYKLHEKIRKCVAEVLAHYPVEARELEFPAGIPRNYSHLPARSVFAHECGMVIFHEDTLKLCDFTADGLTWQSLALRKGAGNE